MFLLANNVTISPSLSQSFFFFYSAVAFTALGLDYSSFLALGIVQQTVLILKCPKYHKSTESKSFTVTSNSECIPFFDALNLKASILLHIFTSLSTLSILDFKSIHMHISNLFLVHILKDNALICNLSSKTLYAFRNISISLTKYIPIIFFLLISCDIHWCNVSTTMANVYAFTERKLAWATRIYRKNNIIFKFISSLNIEWLETKIKHFWMTLFFIHLLSFLTEHPWQILVL